MSKPLWLKLSSNLEVLNQQLTDVQQQANALLSQAWILNGASGKPAAIDWDNTDSAEAKALAAVASTAAVATAAQQATSQMSSQATTNAVADKAIMLHANNAHAAQQLAAHQVMPLLHNKQPLDPSLTAQSLAMNAPVAATKAGSTDISVQKLALARPHYPVLERLVPKKTPKIRHWLSR